MFLTQQRDVNDVDTLHRAATVLPPAQFFGGGAAAAGDDVFLCEYEYDTAWQVGGPAAAPACACACQRVWVRVSEA